ncbi:MAG: DUF3987 domain-containing protein [Thermoflexales bacterium]|nr:DUF3987 domain-containing protein [Thermoflexales bacterium]
MARLPWGEVSPTLWVLILAPSTVFRKTTALGIGRDLLRRAKPSVFAAHQFTPEALWGELQTNPHRAAVVDEFSLLVASTSRDYMTGSIELLMQLADEPPWLRRHTKGDGDVTIQRPSFALLGASTPASLKRFIADERLWASGFWARFAVVVAPDERLPWREAEAADVELAALADELIKLDARLNTDSPLTASIAPEAWALWAEFSKEMTYDAQADPTLSDGFRAVLGRAPTQAMRIALTLATLDWARTSQERTPTVQLAHIKAATAIAASLAEDAQRAIETAQRSVVEELGERILKLLRMTDGEATRRELQRAFSKVKPADLEHAISDLRERGLVEVFSEQGRGGMTTRVRLAQQEGVHTGQPLGDELSNCRTVERGC